MKMKLFYFSINMAADRHTVQIVAPDQQMAAEFLRNHLQEVGGELVDYTILRIDDTLSGDATLGLNVMLENAPVSFASYAEGVGWLAHVAPVHRLHLFRIETPSGAAEYVVAPNENVAAAVWWETCNAPDGEPVLYRIVDGMLGLDDAQRKGIEPLLEFGSIGVASWTNSDWSIIK